MWHFIWVFTVCQSTLFVVSGLQWVNHLLGHLSIMYIYRGVSRISGKGVIYIQRCGSSHC